MFTIATTEAEWLADFIRAIPYHRSICDMVSNLSAEMAIFDSVNEKTQIPTIEYSSPRFQ